MGEDRQANEAGSISIDLRFIIFIEILFKVLGEVELLIFGYKKDNYFHDYVIIRVLLLLTGDVGDVPDVSWFLALNVCISVDKSSSERIYKKE